MLIGYSRGAYAARYLASLVHILGLPKDMDEERIRDIYNACSNGSISSVGVPDELSDGVECWKDVKIDALCCFDTVGSLGLPLTGVAKPLATLRRLNKKHDIVSDVAPNVEFAFHCLSLHETREPYTPTLMRGSNVYQVSFPGCHKSLGRIEQNESLVHGPFAWMIQQVHTFVGISFDEEKLAARFPSYRLEDDDSAKALTPLWCDGPIRQINSGLLAVIGKTLRSPGHINCANGDTDLKVHIGARLRNRRDDVNAVPGYILVAPMTGKPYWARRLQRSRWLANNDRNRLASSESLRSQSTRTGSGTADRIEEARVGALEARLLGLSQEVVTMW